MKDSVLGMKELIKKNALGASLLALCYIEKGNNTSQTALQFVG